MATREGPLKNLVLGVSVPHPSIISPPAILDTIHFAYKNGWKLGRVGRNDEKFVDLSLLPTSTSFLPFPIPGCISLYNAIELEEMVTFVSFFHF